MTLRYPRSGIMVLGWKVKVRVRVNCNTTWVWTLWVPSSCLHDVLLRNLAPPLRLQINSDDSQYFIMQSISETVNWIRCQRTTGRRCPITGRCTPPPEKMLVAAVVDPCVLFEYSCSPRAARSLIRRCIAMVVRHGSVTVWSDPLWCSSGGRGILTELSLCYSIV